MAYIDSSVTGNLDQSNIEALQAALDELEVLRGAPVRASGSNFRGRNISGHTSWRGIYRELEHYAPGTTTDDFREKGITIFFSSWAEWPDNVPELDWECILEINPDQIIETWNRRYENGNRGKPESLTLEIYKRQDTEIDQNPDVVPFIFEPTGTYIGELHDDARCLCLGWEYRNLWGYGTINWKMLLTDPLAIYADPEAVERFNANVAERSRIAFKAMVQDRGNVAINEARKKMDEFAVTAAEAQEELVNAIANRDQYAHQLTYLLDRGDALTEEMIDREWNGIVNNVNVERFIAKNEGAQQILKVFTKDLWLTNPDNGRKLPLGKYEVRLNFSDNNLRIKNLTLPQFGGGAWGAREYVRWDHPHVREGKLCTAEYATAITQLLRDRHLAQMTNMVFSILNTVTMEDDWGRNNILLWEAADDEMRREKGWPQWEDGETEHPMVLAQEGGE